MATLVSRAWTLADRGDGRGDMLPSLGLQNWATRSAQPGVLQSVRFDQQSDVDRWLAGSLQNLVTWEQDNKASGNGSLRFDVPAGAGQGNGNWCIWLSTDEREFLEGDTFYVTFRQYMPDNYIHQIYPGGNGWKQSIISRHASSMDGVGQGTPLGSNQENEIVLEASGQQGFVRGYNRNTAGGFVTFDYTVGNTDPGSGGSSNDRAYQNMREDAGPHTGTLWEQARKTYSQLWTYNQTQPAGWLETYPDPLSPVFPFYSDEWVSYKIRVDVGSQGTTTADSRIRIWAARDGQDWEFLFDYTRDLGLTEDPVSSGQFSYHDALWLLPYNTGRTDAVPTHTLYDEVIVSLDDIAAPVAAVGALPAWLPASGNWVELPGGGAAVGNEGPDISSIWESAESNGQASTTKFDHWNTGAADDNHLLIGAESGHQVGNNARYALGPMNSADINDVRWTRRGNTTPFGQWITSSRYYADGAPSGRHSYDTVAVAKNVAGQDDRLFHLYATAVYNTGSAPSFPAVDAWNLATDTWETAYADNPYYSGGNAAGVVGGDWDPVTERFFCFASAGSGNANYGWLDPYDGPNGSWTPAVNQPTRIEIHAFMSLDYVNRLAFIHSGDSTPVDRIINIDNPTQWVELGNFLGTVGAASKETGNSFDPDAEAFVFWNGGQTVYRVDVPSDPWTPGNWSIQTIAAGGATPSNPPSQGTYGRFARIDSIGCFSVVNNPNETGWVFKL